jgi:hypothetical protein
MHARNTTTCMKNKRQPRSTSSTRTGNQHRTSHAVSLTTLTTSPSMRTVTATTTEHVAGAEKISVNRMSCMASKCRNLQLCSDEVYNISSAPQEHNKLYFANTKLPPPPPSPPPPPPPTQAHHPISTTHTTQHPNKAIEPAPGDASDASNQGTTELTHAKETPTHKNTGHGETRKSGQQSKPRPALTQNREVSFSGGNGQGRQELGQGLHNAHLNIIHILQEHVEQGDEVCLSGVRAHDASDLRGGATRAKFGKTRQGNQSISTIAHG